MRRGWKEGEGRCSYKWDAIGCFSTLSSTVSAWRSQCLPPCCHCPCFARAFPRLGCASRGKAGGPLPEWGYPLTSPIPRSRQLHPGERKLP